MIEVRAGNWQFVINNTDTMEISIFFDGDRLLMEIEVDGERTFGFPSIEASDLADLIYVATRARELAKAEAGPRGGGLI
jgi:hypothetical protein